MSQSYQKSSRDPLGLGPLVEVGRRVELRRDNPANAGARVGACATIVRNQGWRLRLRLDDGTEVTCKLKDVWLLPVQPPAS